MGFGLFELNIPNGEKVWGGGGYGAIVYMAVSSDGEGVKVLLFGYYESNMPIYRNGMQVYYYTV